MLFLNSRKWNNDVVFLTPVIREVTA